MSTYKIQRTENGVPLYMYFQFILSSQQNIIMWTGNPDNPKIWETSDLQEANDKLLYLDNLSLIGKLPHMECLDIVDENGNEVYFE